MIVYYVTVIKNYAMQYAEYYAEEVAEAAMEQGGSRRCEEGGSACGCGSSGGSRAPHVAAHAHCAICAYCSRPRRDE